ncbi:UNVERIFIED_CONTAM: hypothetical protein Sradi_7152500 [Sesamum radiatum]|uniref:Uncharacterized protein n=1 Tax=Sesamum radiatum TaxID=300843 RepID=A0AAW2IXZ4_SESRA
MDSLTGSSAEGTLRCATPSIGSPARGARGIPFSKEVMAGDLPPNFHTIAIAEYDGPTEP